MSDPCTERDKLGVGYLPTYLELEAERDRYREALRRMAEREDETDWYVQQFIDAARAALKVADDA